jgi:hypothetical protein
MSVSRTVNMGHVFKEKSQLTETQKDIFFFNDQYYMLRFREYKRRKFHTEYLLCNYALTFDVSLTYMIHDSVNVVY